MAKKSFMPENPALQFIAAQEEITQTDNKHPIQATDQIISSAENGPQSSHARQLLSSIKSASSEGRSRRVQLLMRPSVHKKLQELAKNSNVSVNEMLNSIIEDFLSNL